MQGQDGISSSKQMSSAPTAASRLVLAAVTDDLKTRSSVPTGHLASLVIGLCRISERVLISEMPESLLSLLPLLLSAVQSEGNGETLALQGVLRAYTACVSHLKTGQKLPPVLLGLSSTVMAMSISVLADQRRDTEDDHVLKGLAVLVLHNSVKHVGSRDETSALMQAALQASSMDNESALLAVITNCNIVSRRRNITYNSAELKYHFYATIRNQNFDSLQRKLWTSSTRLQLWTPQLRLRALLSVSYSGCTAPMPVRMIYLAI